MNDISTPRFDAADYTGILDVQVTALLQRIEHDRDRRCRQLREGAQAQAREIVRKARTEARANVHQAVAQERQRIDQSLRQAEAGVAMLERQREERTARQVLAEMWQALPAQLETRWRDAAHRRTWIQAAVRQACRLLSHREWRIEHGPDASVEECRAAIEATFASSAPAVPRAWSLSIDAGIGAGLRIRAGAACLDATVAGLLAQRTDVEAAFLAHYGAHDPAPVTHATEQPNDE